MMKNCIRYTVAAAPMALMAMGLFPTAPARAAETATVRPMPKIRVITKPAEVENGPHIRTARPTPDSEPVSKDGAVAAETAEAGSAPQIRTRTVKSQVDASTPVEVENSPRIRTRVMTPTDDAAAPHIRVRGSASTGANTDGEPALQNRRHIDNSAVAAPETAEAEGPPPRRRGATTTESHAPADDAATSGPGSRRRIDTDISASAVSKDYVGSVKAGAVILKPGTYQQIIAKLPVTRTLDLNALEASPIVTLGATKFDFSPMLHNPKSLQNVEKRLKALPNLVNVAPVMATASDIKQGLVVHTVLSYQLKSGACSNASNRSLLSNAGISCFTYKSLSAREADFSNPGSIEFVENAGERAAAVSQARAMAQTNAADIAQNVADFRQVLNDPAQRAQIVGTIGADEAMRLEGLDDAALAGELVNFHEVSIDEVAYVPVIGVSLPSNQWLNNWQKAKADALMKKLAAADAQLAGATKAASYPLGDFNFLTGFTLGSKHEWRQGVTTTIKWCVIGCKKTYFAEAWVGFSYGFGLRFPMRFSGTYQFDPAGGGKASLLSNLAMFDGNTEDYRSTGLPEDKLFSGQELVAELGANAGIHAKLPVIGGIGPIEFGPKLKLTDMLPAPFTGGNMKPPMPKSSGLAGAPTEAKFVLEQIDLLGERANLGVVSAKIHPAVYIGVESNGMSLTINGADTQDSFQSVAIAGGQQTTALPMDAGQISNFTVGNPKYNIGFTLTPGLTARLSLNLAVWGTSVDWDVRFPAAQITVPSGGIDFSCHEGTICTRSFLLGSEGPVSPFKKDLKKWGLDFDAYWLPKCLDDVCVTSVKLKRYDILEAAYAQEAALSSGWGVVTGVHKAPLQGDLAVADTAAEKYVEDSKARKAQKSSDTSAAMGLLAQSIYTKQCKDSQCVENVAALAAQMAPRAKQIATAAPYQDSIVTNKQVNSEFAPKFVAEIDASKIRIEMKKAANMKKQADQMGGAKPVMAGTRCKSAGCM